MPREKRKGQIILCLRGKNGYSNSLDSLLLSQGFTLYNVDNYKLKRFRGALVIYKGQLFFSITSTKTYNLLMPRISQIVAAGHPHHITKEGIIGKKYLLTMLTK